VDDLRKIRKFGATIYLSTRYHCEVCGSFKYGDSRIQCPSCGRIVCSGGKECWDKRTGTCTICSSGIFQELEKSKELSTQLNSATVNVERLTEENRELLKRLESLESSVESETHYEGEEVLSRYKLVAMLGKGAQKETWKAVDLKLGGREIALKILRNMRDLEDLRREARVAGKLKHRNIAEVLNIHDDEGFLVEEFITGDNLENVIKDHIINGSWFQRLECIDILKQLLEAICHAHEDVKPPRIHGDIKPANVMIQKDGVVKLTDFGVGKILTKSRKKEYSIEDQKLGSYNWLAPEVLRGGRLSKRSDLFSLGMIAYILFTQKHPFLHPSGSIQITELIKSKTFHSVSPSECDTTIPEELNEIVVKLLEKKVRSRYGNARVVLRKIFEVQDSIQDLRVTALRELKEQGFL